MNHPVFAGDVVHEVVECRLRLVYEDVKSGVGITCLDVPVLLVEVADDPVFNSSRRDDSAPVPIDMGSVLIDQVA